MPTEIRGARCEIDTLKEDGDPASKCCAAMEARAHRPFLLGFVAVLAMIQGAFAVIGGIALIIEHNDADLLRHVDVSSDTLAVFGWVLLVIGVIELFVAIGLWRGNDFARYVVAFLEIIHGAWGIYAVIAYEGTYRWQGLWQLLFALVILYILFNQRSEAFFERR
jgi:hypothetical protein